jgi:para-nitrobenzyl esterase
MGSVSRRTSVGTQRVSTSSGVLEGIRDREVFAFHDIPYAAAPTGAQRFRPPEPALPWTGVRPAREPGFIAPQVPTPLEELYGRPGAVQGEDCLTLSVWTPALDDARRPVVVWIHGGNFVNGSGTTPRTDGTTLARAGDAVVVGVNYRLGSFGFLFLGDLVPGEEDSGVVGLLDQIAALRWVRDEIAAFGGDPGSVTVVGQSAGAMSIGSILGMPAAEGLFHRAVLQSGGPASVRDRAAATATTVDVLAELGIAADTHAADELRKASVAQILAAQRTAAATLWTRARESGGPRGLFSPVHGTPSLPAPPLDAIAAGGGDVPVLLGTTRDELRITRVLDPTFHRDTWQDVDARLATAFGADRLTAARAAYRIAGETPADVAVAVEGDLRFVAPTVRLAEQLSARGTPTWLYEFRHRGTAFEGALRAAHGLEIPFVFDTLDCPGSTALLGEPTDSSRHLARRMRDAWIAFARHGAPSHPALPPWPRFTEPQRPTMIFDDACAVAEDPVRDRRLLWS